MIVDRMFIYSAHIYLAFIFMCVCVSVCVKNGNGYIYMEGERGEGAMKQSGNSHVQLF